jgi:hypothetical protein
MSESNNVSIAPTSRALGSNPKDLLGAAKPDATKVPAIAIAWESLAMMDGAGKYDPYNWRANRVVASIYIAACKRHLDLWFEGEEFAEDSGCHHLGHARACLGILLDAQETGNLIDDRPVAESSRGVLGRVYAKIAAKIPAMRARHEKFRAEQAAKAAAKSMLNAPITIQAGQQNGGPTGIVFANNAEK